MSGGLKREPDGSYTVADQECRCGERYIIFAEHEKWSVRHKQWKRGQLQPEIPVPAQPIGHKYSEKNLPPRILFGDSAPCPRCKGIPTRHKDGTVDALTSDPHKKSQVCPRCDGYGIVPRSGL